MGRLVAVWFQFLRVPVVDIVKITDLLMYVQSHFFPAKFTLINESSSIIAFYNTHPVL